MNRPLRLAVVMLASASFAPHPLLAQSGSKSAGGNTQQNAPLRGWWQSAFTRIGKQPAETDEPENVAPPTTNRSAGSTYQQIRPENQRRAPASNNAAASSNTPPKMINSPARTAAPPKAIPTKTPPRSTPSKSTPPPQSTPSNSNYYAPQNTPRYMPSNTQQSLRDVARAACQCNPDARRSLIAALNDRSDGTRLAAVQSINLAGAYSCPKCGRSVSQDDLVVQVLGDMAFAKDGGGRWLEPSDAVRYAAREALRLTHQPRTTTEAPPETVRETKTTPPPRGFVSEDGPASTPTPTPDASPAAPPKPMTFAPSAPRRGLLPKDTAQEVTPPAAEETPPTVTETQPVAPTRSGIGFVVPGRGANVAPRTIAPRSVIAPAKQDAPPVVEESVEPSPPSFDPTAVVKPQSPISTSPTLRSGNVADGKPIDLGPSPATETNEEPVARPSANQPSINDGLPFTPEPPRRGTKTTTLQPSSEEQVAPPAPSIAPAPATTPATSTPSSETSSRRVKPVPIAPFGGTSTTPAPSSISTEPEAAAPNRPASLNDRSTTPSSPTTAPNNRLQPSTESESPEVDNGPQLGPAAKVPKKPTSTLKTASVTNSLRRTANATLAEPAAAPTLSTTTEPTALTQEEITPIENTPAEAAPTKAPPVKVSPQDGAATSSEPSKTSDSGVIWVKD